MMITWKSSGGSTISFSKDDIVYKLLKNYEGFGTPDISFKTISAPFQDGETLVDTRFSIRKFSFNLMVTGPTFTDIQTAVNTLIRIFNPGSGAGTLGFYYEDGSEYFINCSGKVIPSPTNRSNKHQLVKMELVAHMPLFYTAAQATSIKAGTIMFNIDHITNLRFPFTLPNNAANVIAVNYGDVPTGATFVIRGDVVNPKVSNTFGTTTQYFQFIINMDEGDTMTVTTHFGNKTIYYYDASAGITVNGFQYLTTGSTFFQIMPGDNALSINSPSISSNTEVSVTWNDNYSGV